VSSVCWLVGCLVGDHLLLRDVEPNVIIFMNVLL
jgi:hypothetical protein